MAELTDLLAKMKESVDIEVGRDKIAKITDKRQKKNEMAQLDALESLESSFPAAFAKRAEVMVGEKKPFEHSDILFGIRRSLDGVTRNLRTQFKDFFTNRFGLFPNRAARKRQDAANLAQDLIQADTRMIARGIGIGNERAKTLHDFEKKKWGGLKGLAMGVGGLVGKTMGGGKAVEKAREQEAYQNKMLSCCKRTGDAVKELNENFMESLKEKGKLGLGIIIAAIAAPIIAIVAFFKSIAEQIRWMKMITGERFKKMFAPIRALFAEEGFIGKAMKSIKGIFAEEGVFGKAMKSIKGAFAAIKESKFMVGLTNSFTTGWTKLKNFLTPVGNFFKTIVEKGKLLVEKTKIAKNIVKWAGTLGRLLGRLFLPITFLMSAWDLITGALDGWEKEGKETDATMVTKFIAAIGGGLGKFAENLIGIPLKWLTKGIAWIAEKLGFDKGAKEITEFADKIPGFIRDIIEAPFNLIKNGIKWITDLFGLTPEMTEKKLVGKMMEDYHVASPIDIIMTSVSKFLNDVVNWFKDLFDIDFSSIITSLVPESVVSAAKSIGGALADFFGGGKKGPATGVLGGGMGPLSHDLGASTAEAERLRKENADIKAKVAERRPGPDVITNAPTNIQHRKDIHSPMINTKPDPVIDQLAGVYGGP